MMRPDLIYLDHAATTPVRDEVFEAMRPFFGTRFGNPSSTHRWGREARAALDEARERVASCLGARSDEICFTSGGTESDNLAVLVAWRARRANGRNAVVRDDVAVASVMWVNNEIGTIQPIEDLAGRATSRGVLFHTDAVQAFGKLTIDARAVPFDILSISGHKIGAPKGCGAIFIRRGTVIEPLFHGGTQDRGRRPGTENVAAAIGLARAAELAVAEREDEWARLASLRDRLERAILDEVPDAVVHARGARRAPHILSVSVPGTD